MPPVVNEDGRGAIALVVEGTIERGLFSRAAKIPGGAAPCVTASLVLGCLLLATLLLLMEALAEEASNQPRGSAP